MRTFRECVRREGIRRDSVVVHRENLRIRAPFATAPECSSIGRTLRDRRLLSSGHLDRARSDHCPKACYRRRAETTVAQVVARSCGTTLPRPKRIDEFAISAGNGEHGLVTRDLVCPKVAVVNGEKVKRPVKP